MVGKVRRTLEGSFPPKSLAVPRGEEEDDLQEANGRSKEDFCAILPPTSIRPFHKALQTIAKVGEDVFFEANSDGVQLCSTLVYCT